MPVTASDVAAAVETGLTSPPSSLRTEAETLAAVDGVGDWRAALLLSGRHDQLHLTITLYHLVPEGVWREAVSGGSLFDLPGEEPPSRWWSESHLWCGSITGMDADDGPVSVAGGLASPQVATLRLEDPSGARSISVAGPLRCWAAIWRGGHGHISAFDSAGTQLGPPRELQ